MTAASGGGVRERVIAAVEAHMPRGTESDQVNRWDAQRIADAAMAAVAPAAPTAPETADLLYTAWAVIANASDGTWREDSEWRQAAIRWRDRWHATLGIPAPAAGGSPAPDGGFTAAFCPSCSTLGGHDNLCQLGEEPTAPSPSLVRRVGEQLATIAASLDHWRAQDIRDAADALLGREGDPGSPWDRDQCDQTPCVCQDAPTEDPDAHWCDHAERNELGWQAAERELAALTEAVQRLADRWVEQARRHFSAACELPPGDYKTERYRRENELADDYAERAAELRALLPTPIVEEE